MDIPDFDFIGKIVGKVKEIFFKILSILLNSYKSIPSEIKTVIILILFTICLFFVLWAIRNKDEWKRRKIY